MPCPRGRLRFFCLCRKKNLDRLRRVFWRFYLSISDEKDLTGDRQNRQTNDVGTSVLMQLGCATCCENNTSRKHIRTGVGLSPQGRTVTLNALAIAVWNEFDKGVKRRPPPFLGKQSCLLRPNSNRPARTTRCNTPVRCSSTATRWFRFPPCWNLPCFQSLAAD